MIEVAGEDVNHVTLWCLGLQHVPCSYSNQIILTNILWFRYSPATSCWIKNFNLMGLGCAIFVSECRINYILNANQITLWIWVLLLHHKQKPTKRQLCVGTNSCMITTSNWKSRCFCFCFLCTWKRIFSTWSKPAKLC